MQEEQLEEEVGLLRAGALSPAGQRSEVSHASQPGGPQGSHQPPTLTPGSGLSKSSPLPSSSSYSRGSGLLRPSKRPWKEVPLGLTNGSWWAGKRAANEMERPCQDWPNTALPGFIQFLKALGFVCSDRSSIVMMAYYISAALMLKLLL